MADALKGRRIADIQVLRAAAITFVFLQHFMQWIPVWGPFGSALSSLGLWTGVDLFFAISGYLIVSKLIEGSYEAKGWALFRKFWRSRLWRLMPAAVAWCFLASVILLSIPGVQGASPLQVLSSASVGIVGVSNLYWSACDQNLLVASVCASPIGVHTINWSLSLEEQFYLVASLFLVFGKVRAFVAFLWLACFLNLLSPWSGWPFGWSLRPYSLAAGSCLALLVVYYPKVGAIRLSLPDRLPIFVFVFVAIPALGLFYQPETTMLIGFLSALAVWLARMDDCLSYGLVGKAFVWIGERSYSFYLSHYSMLILSRYAFEKIFSGFSSKSPLATFSLLVVAYALTLFVSALTYRYVELPGNKARITDHPQSASR